LIFGDDFLVRCLVFIGFEGPHWRVFLVCLGVLHIYGTLFFCMLLFKSPSLAFLVLTRILSVLNKFQFNFFKKKVFF
jgi:hypothetical protein